MAVSAQSVWNIVLKEENGETSMGGDENEFCQQSFGMHPSTGTKPMLVEFERSEIHTLSFWSAAETATKTTCTKAMMVAAKNRMIQTPQGGHDVTSPLLNVVFVVLRSVQEVLLELAAVLVVASKTIWNHHPLRLPASQ
jgi:hypothetical protein